MLKGYLDGGYELGCGYMNMSITEKFRLSFNWFKVIRLLVVIEVMEGMSLLRGIVLGGGLGRKFEMGWGDGGSGKEGRGGLVKRGRRVIRRVWSRGSNERKYFKE